MSEEKKKIFLGIEGVPIEHHDLLKKEALGEGKGVQLLKRIKERLKDKN